MPNVDHFIVNPEKCWLKEQHICAIRFIHKLISIQHLGIQPMAEPNIFKVRHCYIGMFRSLIITHFYNQYRKKKGQGIATDEHRNYCQDMETTTKWHIQKLPKVPTQKNSTHGKGQPLVHV